MPDSSALHPPFHTEIRMRVFFLVLGVLIVASAMALPAVAEIEPAAKTLNFAVMRNGEPIGTTTMRISRDGGETVADIVTHIQVKIAYITVYRYDQSETERWVDGKLVAMSSLTDDNGTVHKVSATRSGEILSVDVDGKVAEVDPAVIPVSLWNASLLRTPIAINPQDGKLTPVWVVDHGEEPLVLQGRPTTAHHYSIRTSFPQEVWYDRQHQLLKVELRGSDGSRIQYQPG
jgi:Family of unknown function (DUF6134)